MKNSSNNLKEVAFLFLKLGVIGFGGPAAHIAMMENEVVKKRGWMTHQQFLDLVGATNLIPGPNSTEMTMHCGHERAGVKGLFVAGACFIFPAVIITAIFALLYQKYGTLPEVQPFISGIKPAIISIIIGAAYSLGKKALKSIELIVLGFLTLIACLLDVHEITALFATGFLGVLLYYIKKPNESISVGSPFALPLLNFLSIGKTISSISVLKIFLVFLKVGALLYGSGYVLFAFLQEELVAKGYISMQQLVDAIAVGQFTPGPVFTAATFIGWQISGFWGAMAATLGIFLPSFLFVLLLNPLIPKMRKSKVFSAFLDAVNVAAVAVIVVVIYEMGKQTITDWRSITIALLSLLIVFKFKQVNSALIVIGGAVLGYLLQLI